VIAVTPAVPTADREADVRAFLPLIEWIARHLSHADTPWFGREDLVQEGVLGLLDALEKYDETYVNTFKTYAERRIKGAMQDALREQDWVPRSVRHKMQESTRAADALTVRLGRPATEAEVADVLWISLARYQAWRRDINRATLLSLDTAVSGEAAPSEEAPPSTFSALLAAPEHRPLTSQLLQHLAEATAALPPQARAAVKLYYWDGRSMKATGHLLGCGESRVSQILTKAYSLMRPFVTAYLN
jgi:RNA polymerase sigma factor for flagellar operon FliA